MPFRPVTPSNSMGQNLNEINNITRQLNKEQQVKVFRGPNQTNAITIGKVTDDTYGFLTQDSSGVRRILIGENPADGEPIIAVTKQGFDVIDELVA